MGRHTKLVHAHATSPDLAVPVTLCAKVPVEEEGGEEVKRSEKSSRRMYVAKAGGPVLAAEKGRGRGKAGIIPR
ncbi:hypothetical protein MRX96_012998 [Rhipicephalus microplus]